MTAITLPRAELEQWLEALLFVNWSELDKVEGVITALRERLAQPEQESFSPEAISATQAAWKMGYDAAKAEQPEQEPVACQYAKDVAMPEYRCAGKCQYAQPEQEQWDAIPDAFNEWWNADYDDTGNPYRKDSPAYWAWSGWKAASKQPEQEPVAWLWRCKPHCGWPEWSVSLKRPADAGCDGNKRTEGYEDIPLYTASPQRKPLTKEQCLHLEVHPLMTIEQVVRVVEAAHGIKDNT